MDNCAIHHIHEVVSMIEDVGSLVHFLPPYSLDLTPIEEAFSKVKYAIKSLEQSLDTTNVQTITLAAFATITQKDCQGWISHPKIYGNL